MAQTQIATSIWSTMLRSLMFHIAFISLLIHVSSWVSIPQQADPFEERLINGCRTHIMDRPDFFHMPSTRQELISILHKIGAERGLVKVIGGHHTWSNITSVASQRTKGSRKTHLISLDRYNKVVDLDEENLNVRVQAGIRLWQLQDHLTSRGFTMAQIGSMMEQSVAGAISTGTHGTGLELGIMSTLVTEIELMTIDSNGQVIIHELSDQRNATLMSAARVSLGVLGVISELRLRIARQHYAHTTEIPIPTEEFLADDSVETYLRSNKFVKYWHLPHSGYTYRFTANPLPEDESKWTAHQRALKSGLFNKARSWIDKKLFKTHLLDIAMRLTPIPLIPFTNNLMRVLTFYGQESVDTFSRSIVLQHGIPEHYEAEYIIPLHYWRDMLRTLVNLENAHMVNFIVELRFVRGDDILMSHAQGLDEAAYFTFGVAYSDVKRARMFFADAQEAAEQLAKKHGFPLRVHWGKVLTLFEQGKLREHVKRTQPEFEVFSRIRSELDPLNVFINDFHAHLFNVAML